MSFSGAPGSGSRQSGTGRRDIAEAAMAAVFTAHSGHGCLQ